MFSWTFFFSECGVEGYWERESLENFHVNTEAVVFDDLRQWLGKRKYCTFNWEYSETKLHLFLTAETAVRRQPHGLHHGTGRRHGLHRPWEYPGHPAQEYPSAGSCGYGLPWGCAGVCCHLQEACQEVRPHRMTLTTVTVQWQTLYLQTIHFNGTKDVSFILSLIRMYFSIMSFGGWNGYLSPTMWEYFLR